jgi:hypothetical protein
MVAMITGACLGRAAVPEVPGQGGAPWVELTSDHFTVWTNAAPDDGQAFVRKLEDLWQTVAGVAFPDAPSTGRSLVIAVRDGRELQAFSREDAFSIAPQAPLWQPIMVLSLDSADPTIVHMLAYAVSLTVIPRQPRCLRGNRPVHHQGGARRGQHGGGRRCRASRATPDLEASWRRGECALIGVSPVRQSSRLARVATHAAPPGVRLAERALASSREYREPGDVG